MFRWEKTIQTLNIPVSKVLRLFRSMRDVQLALPGLPPQEASAFLCQYLTRRGVGTAAIFLLHKSGQFAFYVDDPRQVTVEQAAEVFDQAQVFVESMGFLLTDLDIQLLDEADRELLWSSLPLQQGLGLAPPAAVAAPEPASAGTSMRPLPEATPVSPGPPGAVSAAPAEPSGEQPTHLPGDAQVPVPTEVDQLLAGH